MPCSPKIWEQRSSARRARISRGRWSRSPASARRRSWCWASRRAAIGKSCCAAPSSIACCASRPTSTFTSCRAAGTSRKECNSLCHYFISQGAASIVTGIIYAFHLYPTIPNISIVYLLVILVLASTRGRYAAILAAVIAFLSFDFFLVPPFL
ncbi:MAG: DUF4118 domain-containing protein [Chloroflexi bacterium]|nr:MAG: DUF4118 domain-containing protein [Chloroflexota bacterium]